MNDNIRAMSINKNKKGSPEKDLEDDILKEKINNSLHNIEKIELVEPRSYNSSKETYYTDILNNDLIKQNLDISEETLKLVLIGDSNIGKSLFINRILKDTTTNEHKHYHHSLYKYNPTTSLEIKKVLTDFSDRKVKLELFDTNKSIINSKMINSIIYS